MLFWFIFILVVFFCLGEFNLNGRWNRSLMQRIGVCIITLVSVLRFDVGFDYFSYYKDILDATYDRYEPLSWLIFHFAYTIKYSPIAFMLVGCLTYFFAISTIWKFSKNRFIGIMVYVCIFYLTSLGYIRQALAVSITFWGIRYIYQKSFIKYLLTCVLAILFHYSAFLAIIIYPMYRFMTNKMIFISLVSIYLTLDLALLFLSDIRFYGGIAEGLLANEVDPATGGGRYVRLAMVFIVLFSFFVNYFKKVGIDNKLLGISATGLLFPFVLGPHFGMRIGDYFFIYLCLTFPETLSVYSVKFRTVTAIFLACYFMILIGVGRDNVRPSFLPYQSVFSIENPMRPLLRWPE